MQGKEEILALLARIYDDEVSGFEDAYTAVDVGFPIYLPFLDHPDHTVRMWDVYLLSFFTERREEVRAAFKSVLERPLKLTKKLISSSH